MDETDQQALAAGYGVDKEALRQVWKTQISAVLKEATLQVPADGWQHLGGRAGKHTEHMGFLLAEMQYLQRTFPGAKW
jgi:ring-1,2-phenylacetyl-CoA epoxidase subunit PaaC